VTDRRRFSRDTRTDPERSRGSGGTAEPAAAADPATDAVDLASTDMSAQPSSRDQDTQSDFIPGHSRLPAEPQAEAVRRLESQLEEARERHLRLAAEFDNYRKRNAKERAELSDRAQANFVAKLLDVLDDLDRLVASDAESTPLASLREGLSAVDRKLWKQLEDAGVERIDPRGEAFDPSLHEAVSIVPPPDPSLDHTVSATFQSGYRFKGNLVRPARVQVYSEQGQA
jgi:molecular chaperone GrpE